MTKVDAVDPAIGAGFAVRQLRIDEQIAFQITGASGALVYEPLGLFRTAAVYASTIGPERP